MGGCLLIISPLLPMLDLRISRVCTRILQRVHAAAYLMLYKREQMTALWQQQPELPGALLARKLLSRLQRLLAFRTTRP
jgi:hypothetical protein